MGMSVTIDYGLEESDAPHSVDVPALTMMDADAIDLMNAFMETETATGSYYRALYYIGHGRTTVYRYFFTDYKTAFQFKLRFG